MVSLGIRVAVLLGARTGAGSTPVSIGPTCIKCRPLLKTFTLTGEVEKKLAKTPLSPRSLLACPLIRTLSEVRARRSCRREARCLVTIVDNIKTARDNIVKKDRRKTNDRRGDLCIKDFRFKPAVQTVTKVTTVKYRSVDSRFS